MSDKKSSWHFIYFLFFFSLFLLLITHTTIIYLNTVTSPQLSLIIKPMGFLRTVYTVVLNPKDCWAWN